MRDPSCPKYDECLKSAALKDVTFNCLGCTKDPVFEKQPLEKRMCPQCRTWFVPKGADQKFHNPACRRIWNNRRRKWDGHGYVRRENEVYDMGHIVGSREVHKSDG